MQALGTGFDCASKGELKMMLKLGVHPSNIIFAHPCKRPSDIQFAKVGVRMQPLVPCSRALQNSQGWDCTSAASHQEHAVSCAFSHGTLPVRGFLGRPCTDWQGHDMGHCHADECCGYEWNMSLGCPVQEHGVEYTTFDTESELHKVAALHPGFKLVLRIRADDPGARVPLGIKYGAGMQTGLCVCMCCCCVIRVCVVLVPVCIVGIPVLLLCHQGVCIVCIPVLLLCHQGVCIVCIPVLLLYLQGVCIPGSVPCGMQGCMWTLVNGSLIRLHFCWLTHAQRLCKERGMPRAPSFKE